MPVYIRAGIPQLLEISMKTVALALLLFTLVSAYPKPRPRPRAIVLHEVPSVNADILNQAAPSQAEADTPPPEIVADGLTPGNLVNPTNQVGNADNNAFFDKIDINNPPPFTEKGRLMAARLRQALNEPDDAPVGGSIDRPSPFAALNQGRVSDANASPIWKANP